jgi:hypothetical protein
VRDVPEPVNEPVHDEDDGKVPVGDLTQSQHSHDDHHLHKLYNSLYFVFK